LDPLVSYFHWSKFNMNKESEGPYINVETNIKGLKYSDKVTTPLLLEKVEVEIEILPTSQFYKQSTTLTFKNFTNKKLEGEFVFPIPEYSTICGFSYEINDEMVEASIVEKLKAEKTFTSEVSKENTVSFVESISGNQFRTKIYPWEPNSNKKVKVDFVANLKMKQKTNNFLLDILLEISKQEKLSYISISLKISGEQKQIPILLSNEKIEFLEKQEGVFHMEIQRNQFKGLDHLKIQIPSNITESVLVEKNPLQETFYFDIKQNVEMRNLKEKEANHISILWDSSLSRDNLVKRELEFLKEILKSKQGKLKIDLFIFSNTLEFKGTLSDESEVLNILNELEYDGGTNLIQLEAFEFGKYDYCLFFTDGFDSLSFVDCPYYFQSKCPIYTINSKEVANFKVLRRISEESNGRFIHLDETSELNDLVSSIGTSPFCLLFVEFNEDEICEIYPSKPTPIESNSIHINGILLSEVAYVVLNFGFGEEILEKKKVTLTKKNAQTSTIIGIQWATQCLNELDTFSNHFKDQILEIGRKFSIVTENTSLMVLHTLQQHIDNGIAPSKSRKSMYEDYQKHLLETEKLNHFKTGQKLEKVKNWWNAYLEWYQKDFVNGNEMMNKTTEIHQEVEVKQKELANLQKELSKRFDSAIQKKHEEMESKFKEEQRLKETDFENFKEEIQEELNKINESKVRSRKISALQSKIDKYLQKMKSTEFPDSPDKKIQNKRKRVSQTARKSTGGKAPRMAGKTSNTAGLSTGGGTSAKELPSESENTSLIKVKEWNSDLEYIQEMNKVEKENYYSTYLKLRENEKFSPAFYLDICSFLFNKNMIKESLKVISNLTELEFDSPQLLRIIAYKLEEIGELKLCIQMFRKVLSMNPHEPQSYRDLALVLEKIGNYKEALQLFYKVLIGEWTSDFEEIEITVLQEMNRLIEFHGTCGVEIPKEFIKNTPLELRIVMAWDSFKVDIDLHTMEPNGDHVYFGKKLSTYGGLNSRDFRAGYGPETYSLKHALPGVYKISSNFYSNHQQRITGGTTILLSLFTDYGVKDKEKCKQIIVKLNGINDNSEIGEIEIKNEERGKWIIDLNFEQDKLMKLTESIEKIQRIEEQKKQEIFNSVESEYLKKIEELKEKLKRKLVELKDNLKIE
jgi:Ca-activated chloride channel homolog